MKKFSPLKRLPPLRILPFVLLSSALLFIAFPPLALGVVSFVALIPIFVAFYRCRCTGLEAYNTGYWFGMFFFIAHMWWMLDLLPASSITMPWLMFPALLLLALYLSIYTGLFFLLLQKLGKARPVAGVFLAPALWSLIEMLRASGEIGFPWASIAYSLSRTVTMMQGASFVGVFGVGFIVVLVNVLWSQALVTKTPRVKTLFFVLGGLLFFANYGYGKRTVESFAGNEPAHRVAVMQPNVDLALKWQETFRDSTFDLIERLSRQAANLDPELIVFPETCAPVYLRQSAPHLMRLSNLAHEIDTPIFIGFLDARYDGPDNKPNVYNASGLLSPEGGLETYAKVHLLPFGEAMPYAWKFRSLKKIDFGQANFEWGTKVEPIPSQIGMLSPLICFEAIFPDLSRKFVRRGGDVLLNITNDGWFGVSAGPRQHNDMAIFRTVENRRYLLRSANTGISMVVDPVGRIMSSIGLNEEGILVETIHTVVGKTFYTRFGDWPLITGCLLLTILGVVIGRQRISL